MKTKKYNIDNVEDVEKLFQAFKKRLVKDFDNGVSPDGEGIKMSKWIKKKTGMSKPSSIYFADRFLKQVLKEIN